MKKKFNFTEAIWGLYKMAVTGFFMPILVLLLFFAAFSTCYMVTDWTEKTFFVKDNVLLNLVSPIVVILISTALKKSKRFIKYLEQIKNEEAIYRKWKKILLGIILGMGLFWVLVTQGCPQGDQEFIQNAVYDLNTKNYILFSEGGYLYRFAQQRGLSGFIYLFSLIFGSYNYIAFQVFNVLGLGLFYHQMEKICGHFGMNRVIRLKVLLYGILFFPLIMYCSFVYGNIWGIAFAMVALRYEILFLESKKIRYAVTSAVSIMLMLLLKSNYIVFLIGMSIIALVEMIRKKQVRFLLLPALAILLWIGQGKAVNTVFEKTSGITFGQEASKWSWIAMGLQEGNRAPGWYNDFVWYTYNNAGYNAEAHDVVVKESIRESLQYFTENKWEAVEFFAKKMSSQWNNPTFQALWIMQVQTTKIVRSNWVWHLLSAKGTDKCVSFLNLFQFIVLAGAFLYCILYRKSSFFGKSLSFALFFVGGTMCHLIWEAKGQYVLAYFVLLFPYASAGYSRLTDCLSAAIKKRNPSPQQLLVTLKGYLRQTSPSVIGFAFFVTIVLSGVIVLLCAGGCLNYLTADTQAYANYLSEMDTTPKLGDGIYRLCTNEGYVLSHQKTDYGNLTLCSRDKAEKTDNIRVVNFQDNTWLYFIDCSEYLSFSGTALPELDGWGIAATPSQRNSKECWSIKATENGGFYIVCNTYYALTYDKENQFPYVALFTESENQIWYVETP